MLQIKKSNERGYSNIGWLESYFSFSFADYYNPQQMGFSHLRVINEDFVQPNTGFDFHPHRDMEIITFILSGELTHRDNLGNTGKISQGNVQLMRAGSGILHSEMNLSREVCHLLQIWIKPNQKSLTPSWCEKQFNSDLPIDILVQPIEIKREISLLNPALKNSELQIYQNAYILKIQGNQSLNFNEFGESDIYIQTIHSIKVLDSKSSYNLNHGDALLGSTHENLEFEMSENSIAIVFVFPKI